MTDDNTPTADLTDREVLDRVLAKLGDLDARLGAIEAQQRTATRPLLDRIIQETIETREVLSARIDAVENKIDRVDRRLETFALDVLDVRSDQRRQGDRIDLLERRAS